MRLDDYNRIAEKKAPSVTRYRAALISVHGMNTRGKWQKDLVPDVSDLGIRYMLVDYGHVIVGVLFRRRRRAIIRDILTKYREQRKHSDRVAAVAHSFGSLTLMQAVLQRTRLRFFRIILYGCVVDRKYPWQKMHDAGRIERVLHETSKKDILPRIAPIFVPDSGASGCKGFIDCPSFIEEREYPEAGHSGLQYREHYRDKWIPFILS